MSTALLMAVSGAGPFAVGAVLGAVIQYRRMLARSAAERLPLSAQDLLDAPQVKPEVRVEANGTSMTHRKSSPRSTQDLLDAPQVKPDTTEIKSGVLPTVDSNDKEALVTVLSASDRTDTEKANGELSSVSDAAHVSDVELLIPVNAPEDLRDLHLKLSERMQQMGIDQQQVSGDPALTYTSAAGKSLTISDPEDLENAELPGHIIFVFKVTTASASPTLDVEGLRHALVAGNAGPQHGETKLVADIKVALVRLENGTWQRRASGQQLASFLTSGATHGTVRLYVPMGEDELAPAANLLVLNQGAQQLRQLREDCLMFAEVDYSTCSDPDEACTEDLAVTFESTEDCESFKAAWKTAAGINRKALVLED